MNIAWLIRKKEDGTLDIFENGGLLHKAVPQVSLQRQLDPYGIIGDTYENVLCQLAENGEASVAIPLPGKFSQG